MPELLSFPFLYRDQQRLLANMGTAECERRLGPNAAQLFPAPPPPEHGPAPG